MKKTFKSFARALLLTASAVLLMGASDCTDDDDVDYDPPAGFGALGVDNNSDTDLDVYIDGTPRLTVDEGRRRSLDLAPGDYRVVLEERGGNRSFSGNVDILLDRITVMDITSGYGTDFDVYVYFE